MWIMITIFNTEYIEIFKNIFFIQVLSESIRVSGINLPVGNCRQQIIFNRYLLEHCHCSPQSPVSTHLAKSKCSTRPMDRLLSLWSRRHRANPKGEWNSRDQRKRPWCGERSHKPRPGCALRTCAPILAHYYSTSNSRWCLTLKTRNTKKPWQVRLPRQWLCVRLKSLRLCTTWLPRSLQYALCLPCAALWSG